MFDIRVESHHVEGMERPGCGKLNDTVADFHLLPLEVKLDQDMLMFLREVFDLDELLGIGKADKKEEKEEKAEKAEEEMGKSEDVVDIAALIAAEMERKEEIDFYLQRLTFSGTTIKIEYNAKSFHLGNLLPGDATDITELANFSSLDGLFSIPAIDESGFFFFVFFFFF